MEIVWALLKYLFLFLIISGLIVAGAAYKYIQDVVAETPKITEYDILQLLDENSFIYDNAGYIFRIKKFPATGNKEGVDRIL